jgi:oxidoreductase
MAGQSALLIGATGATGKYVLKELLSSPHFSRFLECGRRVTPIDQISSGKEKLEQKIIDFEKLEEAGLNSGKWDVVFITLGTTRANAGSAAAFEKIDRDYVINAAHAAKTEDSSHSQRLVYLSSGGANASSPMLYTRSKGLTEVGLARLGYSDTIIFRPGVLKGAERPGLRLPERVVGYVTGALTYISPNINIEIQVPILAKSIVLAGQLGSSALPPVAEASKAGQDTPFTLIGNKGAVALAKTAV